MTRDEVSVAVALFCAFAPRGDGRSRSVAVALFCACATRGDARPPSRLPKPPLGSFCIFKSARNARGRSTPVLPLPLGEGGGEGARESRGVRLSRTLTLTLSRRERGPDLALLEFLGSTRISYYRRRCAFGARSAQPF